MSSNPTDFNRIPIISWAVDDFETLRQNLSDYGDNLNDLVETYTRTVYNPLIRNVIQSSPFALNLGGSTTKQRLTATDKPVGVFNFSLASKTLYALREFYSEQLANDNPNRFSDLGLPKGLVPNDLVSMMYLNGEQKFYFVDKDNGNKEYLCIRQKKGQNDFDNDVEGARYYYASKTKKVYQTYKRKGGKVKYVEIYSLYYYAAVEGNFQFAARHFPVMMVAEYLESVGIKTRVYMTRFANPSNTNTLKKKLSKTKQSLPMSEVAQKELNTLQFDDCLIVQPMIVKEFQQEMDLPLAFMVCSNNIKNVYLDCIKTSFDKETSRQSGRYFGGVLWSQEQYWVGFERYRNKYQQYVELGLFKSKEVLPESMIFFHDISIQSYMRLFFSNLKYVYDSKNNRSYTDSELVLIPEVSRFFSWWMRTSANVIKHKINVINSVAFTKDVKEIISDITNSYNELQDIVRDTQDKNESDEYQTIGRNILVQLKILSGKYDQTVNFENYVNGIVEELTTYAEDTFYPTPEEDIERREAMKLNIQSELKKV